MTNELSEDNKNKDLDEMYVSINELQALGSFKSLLVSLFFLIVVVCYTYWVLS